MSEMPSYRAWQFHSHAYFDHTAPEQITQARTFMELIRRTFAGDADLEVRRFHAAPAGPHPRGSFEVLFRGEAFAGYVSWLMFARPREIDILIHPVTRSQVLDHTARALWLGTPLTLDRRMLEAEDARLLASDPPVRTHISEVEFSITHCPIF